MEREAAAGQAAPGPDPQAGFGAFWNQHYRYYLTVLMAIGASMEDAHDTISDVIVDMLRKNTWGRLTTNPRAWVRKAVLHAYYDQQNRQRLEREKRKRLKREIEGYLTLTPGSYVDGQNVWEDWQWMQQMLSTLPPTQRTVIELIIAESDAGEIAGLLGKSPDAIRQNLAHARKRLRANLGQDYQVDPATCPPPAPRKEDTREHR